MRGVVAMGEGTEEETRGEMRYLRYEYDVYMSACVMMRSLWRFCCRARARYSRTSGRQHRVIAVCGAGSATISISRTTRWGVVCTAHRGGELVQGSTSHHRGGVGSKGKRRWCDSDIGSGGNERIMIVLLFGTEYTGVGYYRQTSNVGVRMTERSEYYGEKATVVSSVGRGDGATELMRESPQRDLLNYWVHTVDGNRDGGIVVHSGAIMETLVVRRTGVMCLSRLRELIELDRGVVGGRWSGHCNDGSDHKGSGNTRGGAQIKGHGVYFRGVLIKRMCVCGSFGHTGLSSTFEESSCEDQKAEDGQCIGRPLRHGNVDGHHTHCTLMRGHLLGGQDENMEESDLLEEDQVKASTTPNGARTCNTMVEGVEMQRGQITEHLSAWKREHEEH
ncbi:hypothetical protein Tco_0115077 [Tanacetum coccineum]